MTNKRSKRRGQRIWVKILIFVLVFPIFAAVLFHTYKAVGEYKNNLELIDKVDGYMYFIDLNFADGDANYYVTSDIQLDKYIEVNGKDYEIRWESSDNQCIDSNGHVNRPQRYNRDVTMTAIIEVGGVFTRRSYDLTVIKSDLIDESSVKVVVLKDYLGVNKDVDVKYDANEKIVEISGNMRGQYVQSKEDAKTVLDAYREMFDVKENGEFECINIQKKTGNIVYSFVLINDGIEVSDSGFVVLAKNGVLHSIERSDNVVVG